MINPLLLFFLYNYKEPNRYKYPRIQSYKGVTGNLVKKTPDTICTQKIIEVQLRILEKVQAPLYTNKFLLLDNQRVLYSMQLVSFARIYLEATLVGVL